MCSTSYSTNITFSATNVKPEDLRSLRLYFLLFADPEADDYENCV